MDLETEIRQSGISKKTARRYVAIINATLKKYGVLNFEVAKTEVIYQLDTNSPASANKYSLAYKAYCRITGEEWAKALKKKTEHPAPKRIPRIELARDICFLQSNDAEHNKYSILFELMFLTGMRMGECRTLLSKNISNEEIIIAKSKTGAGRRIAVPPFKHVKNVLLTI